jgi:translation initiation factor IF-1
MDNNKEENTAEGIIIEALPNTMFKVLLNDKKEVLAFLSGKMRMNRIKVIVGDKVTLILDQYGGKARIFKRN